MSIATDPLPRSPASPSATRSTSDANAGRKRDEAQRAAGLLVSQLFFAPLLAEMRKLPFGKQFAHGGRGEEVFGEQLDQRLADIVASRDGGLRPLIAASLTHETAQWLSKRLAARRAYAEQAASMQPGRPAARSSTAAQDGAVI